MDAEYFHAIVSNIVARKFLETRTRTHEEFKSQ